jgi:hypothetical protein
MMNPSPGFFMLQKGMTPTERYLARIYVLVSALVVIHLLLFILIVIVFSLGVRTVNYYRVYLDGPLAGDNVAGAVTNAFTLIESGRNITDTVAIVTAAVTASIGLPTSSGRRLLQLDHDIKESLANLINATSVKVLEFNATAPSDFLSWIVRTDWRQLLEPKVIELLTIGRYGVATAGSALRALGTPVDPKIVGRLPPWQGYDPAAIK